MEGADKTLTQHFVHRVASLGRTCLAHFQEHIAHVAHNEPMQCVGNARQFDRFVTLGARVLCLCQSSQDPARCQRHVMLGEHRLVGGQWRYMIIAWRCPSDLSSRRLVISFQRVEGKARGIPQFVYESARRDHSFYIDVDVASLL